MIVGRIAHDSIFRRAKNCGMGANQRRATHHDCKRHALLVEDDEMLIPSGFALLENPLVGNCLFFLRGFRGQELRGQFTSGRLIAQVGATVRIETAVIRIAVGQKNTTALLDQFLATDRLARGFWRRQKIALCIEQRPRVTVIAASLANFGLIRADLRFSLGAHLVGRLAGLGWVSTHGGEEVSA